MKINTPAQNPELFAPMNRRRIALISSLIVGLSTTLAQAQDEPSSADTAAARGLAIEGLKLADAGHCAQAIDKLYRAEKLRHSPIVLGRLGECQIEEGKIVDGTEDLQRMLHETLPANAPANFLRARERAQTALDAAKPRIAMLTIAVRGPTENVVVTVDGQPVPSLLLEHGRPTDPGEHVIDATATGYFKASRSLTLSEGQSQEVTLKLRVDPQAAAPPLATPKPDESHAATAKTAPQSYSSTVAWTEPNPTKQAPPNRTASTILWITGGAVVATGGVFGYLALSDKKSLDNQCPNNACPTSSKGTLDTANRTATVSTVLVGAGAAGLALGTLLYFTAGSSTTTEHPRMGFQPHAFVGLNRVGLEGTF